MKKNIKLVWNIIKPLFLIAAYLAYGFKGVFWCMAIVVVPTALASLLIASLIGGVFSFTKEIPEKTVLTIKGEKYKLVKVK
jgi:uncharacterized membrane protein YccF (DUF307 family)